MLLPVSVSGSAALPIRNMTKTGIQIPSLATSGAPRVRPTRRPRHDSARAGCLARLVGYAGVPSPPTLAACLRSARAWLVWVTQLKARVAGLQFAIR